MRSRGTRRLLALALMAAVTACARRDLLGPNAEQGINGTVLIGPQCPTASSTNPCPDLPYQAWIEIRDARGFSVTRIQSGEDGRFMVGLRSGLYTLIPESGDPFPVAGEQSVVVAAGVYTQVLVSFDTGIR